MKKQLQILLAGVLVVAPIGVTIWLICWIGSILDGFVARPLAAHGFKLFPGVGAIILLVGLYLVGLLTRFWLFSTGVDALEKLMVRIPGVKSIYESVRDLLKLFGGQSKRMGRAVQYCPPGSELTLLGILTNDKPVGVGQDGQPKVAVYLPLSYMIGGPTVYVSPEHVRDADMSVEQVLKLSTIAQVSSQTESVMQPSPPSE